MARATRATLSFILTSVEGIELMCGNRMKSIGGREWELLRLEGDVAEEKGKGGGGGPREDGSDGGMGSRVSGGRRPFKSAQATRCDPIDLVSLHFTS